MQNYFSKRDSAIAVIFAGFTLLNVMFREDAVFETAHQCDSGDQSAAGGSDCTCARDQTKWNSLS